MRTRFLAGPSPIEARRSRRKTVDNGNRTFSFTKGPKLVGVESIIWTHTIAGARLDTAEHYCTDVWAWAAQIVRDSEALMRTAGGRLAEKGWKTRKKGASPRHRALRGSQQTVADEVAHLYSRYS